MRNRVATALVCFGLLVGTATLAGADDGDVHQAGANFAAAGKAKANNTPVLRAVMSIPADLVPGTVFVVNCLIEATKSSKGKPAKGLQGSVATFANQLDVGSGSWEFFGLVGSGLPFTTGKDGTAVVTTGPVTAGAWANAPGGNDNLSISATFTNGKRVVTTSLGCELVIGATERESVR